MNTKNNEWITLERELAAKDAEIARLTAVGPVSGASESDVYQWLRDAQARITELERQLAEAGEDKARYEAIKRMSWDNLQALKRERQDSPLSSFDAAIDAACARYAGGAS